AEAQLLQLDGGLPALVGPFVLPVDDHRPGRVEAVRGLVQPLRRQVAGARQVRPLVLLPGQHLHHLGPPVLQQVLDGLAVEDSHHGLRLPRGRGFSQPEAGNPTEWVSMNSRMPSMPISRPMPLWLKPPKGARSSRCAAPCALTNVYPVRSRAAMPAARSGSAVQTEEHRPDQVSLARATASSTSSNGRIGSVGPNCSSVTTRASSSGSSTSDGCRKLPRETSAPSAGAPNSRISAPDADAWPRSSRTYSSCRGWCSGPIVTCSSR